MSLSRRRFLQGSLMAAGAGGLSACSSIGAGVTGGSLPADTVNYWNLFGGGDGVRMQEMQKGFEKANPKLGLQAVTLTWGNPYYTKLSLATIGDKPPDVAVSHLSRVPTLVSAGLLQPLSPDDLSRHGMSEDKFSPGPWKQCQFNGQTYAIPLDTHPIVLFYNTKLCKKAGLLDGSGNLKSMEGESAFVDALDKLKKAGAQWGGVCSVDADTATNWRFFQSLYSQLGGEVLSNDGTKVVLDDAKATKVLDYLKHLTVDSKLMPANVDYGGAVAMFASGQAGFYLEGEWEISTFQTAKMPFSMTLFPNVFGGSNYKVQGDSHTLIVPKLGNSDQRRTDRALAFVKSMLDQSLTWAEGGHVPAWLPVKESADYKKLKPQSNYAEAGDAAVYDPPAWYSGSGSNFENVTGSAIATVRAGQASPKSAVEAMRKGLQTYADPPAPA